MVQASISTVPVELFGAVAPIYSAAIPPGVDTVQTSADTHVPHLNEDSREQNAFDEAVFIMGDSTTVVNDNELNLQILKRVDPDVDEVSAWTSSSLAARMPTLLLLTTSLAWLSMTSMQVLATAGHVCLYYMHVTSQQWVSACPAALAKRMT